ncbi:MAG: phosphoesterase [Desulfobacteraceae bacterium]|nr:MAG: phosphoesterase [Desulfobacteraceae bacterium]
MAAKRLLWRRVAGVTIAHINTISRPDNMAMVSLLSVPLIHISKVDIRHYKKFIIIDSQPNHNESFPAIGYTAVIDHHPDTNISAPYLDIRPEYGATASMMTEYLRAARIKPSAKLATGLFYAIKTDTADFERKAVNEDMRAFQFLFKHANIHLARKIEQVDLRLDFLEDFKKAINGHILKKNKIFVNLGSIKNTDICVLIADFFMRFDRVSWSIVSGIHDNKLIIVVRNNGSTKNAGSLMSDKFGKFGSAGGHRSMARAEASIEMLKPHIDVHNEARLLKWLMKKFEKPSSQTLKSKKTGNG